ncbi:MAG: TonB-dependent receptor [Bacteroidetes bacterium]|nr:TonB-dependent receptor [Fibrella sp.]
MATQYSYVSRSFSGALNTPTLTANGAKDPVPAYGLWDVKATWRAGKRLTLQGSISNLTSHQYFTRRPTFYPGLCITLSVELRL